MLADMARVKRMRPNAPEVSRWAMYEFSVKEMGDAGTNMEWLVRFPCLNHHVSCQTNVY